MVDIPLFTRFYTSQVVIAGFLPSTVAIFPQTLSNRDHAGILFFCCRCPVLISALSSPKRLKNVCMCHGVSKSLVNPTFEANFITVSILIHILWWFRMGKLQRWVEWPITKWPTFLGKMNSGYISPSPTTRVATCESTHETHLVLF